MRVAFLAPIAILAAGVAVAHDLRNDAKVQAKLDRALAGLVPGTPTSCVPISFPSLNTHVYGRTILYIRSPAEIYRNDTAGGCESAAGGDILIQVEQEGRPCSGDIIRTVEPTTRMTTGSCALRDFVPYRRPGK